ncbi:MAG TPA: lytic murein transglycosylase B [Povalibacter sp.]|uniref:lytic murein transglycosylase B n=1 Tax=Povalibacter sp. TaxID=1962978 RepID=UPI002C0E493A|nr:lytic murein transglycosylase B [Povalibacter sp.]HMN44459.1 lytic murein transglycosylase B [Povalibacter sp.]
MTQPPTATALLACITLSSPALAVDTSRSEVREFIAEMQRDYEFDPDALTRLLSKAETKQNILDAISRPAERVVPWHEYRLQFLNPQRIQYGVRFRDEHPERLKAIGDAQLANTVLGILGVETSYGRITGRFRVIDALTTLAFDYPPRGEFFRSELQQFLLLTREEAVDPLTALGSYAGAMGSPQFISSSYRKYAIDADDDGRRDLWSSWDDIVGSVANYLRAFGWRQNEEVVVEAAVAAEDIDRFSAGRIELNETVQSLRTKGARFETRMPDDAPAMLVIAQGKDGPVYRVGFNNFYVITRYNRSTMYSMAVHDLGEAVAGASR